MTTMQNFTTVTMTPLPFRGNSINSAARAVFATLGSLMIVCGVTGNLCVITVIFRRFHRKRYVHNLFIANLALADILTLGYWLTFFVLDLILGYYPVVDQGHCVVNGMVIGILSVVSILSLVSISLNRYLHVCHSHLYRRIFTLPRTLLSCLLTWILGLVLSLPPALEVGADAYHYNPLTHICSFNREKLTYSKILVLIFSTLPMLCIGYWNFAIFRFWKRARMNTSHRYPSLTRGDSGRKPKWRLWRRRGSSVNAEDPVDQEQHSKDSDCAGDLPDGQNSAIATEDMSELPENNDTARRGLESKEVQNEENSEPKFAQFENMAEQGGRAIVKTEHVIEGDGCKDPGCTAYPHQLPKTEGVREEKIAIKSRLTVSELVLPCPVKEASNSTEQVKIRCLNSSSGNRAEDKDKNPNTLTLPRPADVKAPVSCSSTSSPKISRSRRQKHNLSKAVHNLQLKRKKQKAREMAFVRSLFVVFILMFICFIPYGVSIVISSYITIPDEVIILGIMFLFTNNTVNWIVYGVMNPAFRKGYMECVSYVLQTCCRVREDRTPRFLKASQSSLTTVSVQRYNTDNDMEQSCTSQVDSGGVL